MFPPLSSFLFLNVAFTEVYVGQPHSVVQVWDMEYTIDYPWGYLGGPFACRKYTTAVLYTEYNQ